MFDSHTLYIKPSENGVRCIEQKVTIYVFIKGV